MTELDQPYLRVVEAANGEVSVVSHTQSVARPSVGEAIGASHALEADDPLRLRSGQVVSFDVKKQTQHVILKWLVPADELRSELEEAYEGDATGDPGGIGYAANINARNEVDGASWSWTRTGAEEWHLVPEGEGVVIAGCSLWMSANMAGGVFSSGIRRWGDVALSWYQEDEQGITWCPIDYGVEDWDALLRQLFWRTFEEPICPGCDTGWVVNIGVDEMFGLPMRTEVVGMAFEPCSEHEADCRVTDIAGHDWTWVGTGWKPDG